MTEEFAVSPDRSHDVVMLVDVIHAADDPVLLTREEARRAVAREVIIVDHMAGAWLSHERLLLMDWVGNIGNRVTLRYTYWSPDEWQSVFAAAGLREIEGRERLELFGTVFGWLCERRLHFISRLVPEAR